MGRVQDVMTANPTTVETSTNVAEAAKMMAQQDLGPLPVTEGGRLVGIVTDRDIVCRTVAEDKNPLEMTAESCMSTSVVTVTPDASLGECCELMEENQLRRIPVVDENGVCCGIVAQADVATHGPEEEAGELVKEVSQLSRTAAAK